MRYLSFSGHADLAAEVQKRCPLKIDIGAVYSARPCEKRAIAPAAFVAKEKELVFDIDMTDYDDVRTCCSGASICPKCWRFITIAIHVLDRALREDFGFQHLLWVYSGRRGVHCWVCDARARCLSQEARAAIVRYLSVIEVRGATVPIHATGRSGADHGRVPAPRRAASKWRRRYRWAVPCTQVSGTFGPPRAHAQCAHGGRRSSPLARGPTRARISADAQPASLTSTL